MLHLQISQPLPHPSQTHPSPPGERLQQNNGLFIKIHCMVKKGTKFSKGVAGFPWNGAKQISTPKAMISSL